MTARALRQMNQPIACAECGGYEDPTPGACPEECGALVCDGCLDRHLTAHEDGLDLVAEPVDAYFDQQLEDA